MWLLAVLFGLLVGVSLGLTGGGGSIFAVPLLVYGLALAPRDAVGVSLAAVGATALVGAIERLRANQGEIPTGLIFAAAGVFGAPLGSWLAGLMPEALLLGLFGALMFIVAARMWRSAQKPEVPACDLADADGPTCRRDAAGKLVVTSRCTILLCLVGLVTGVLSGLFGVGGGFVIVPALVIFSGMKIHRAVATSLLVIALISVSGVSSHLLAGRDIPLVITTLFVVGGIAGLYLGNITGRRFSGPALQRIFAAAIVVVATFVLVQTFV